MQNYVATEIFSKDCGRKLARLQKKRETSDYDDFYIASAAEANEQIDAASFIIDSVKTYLLTEKVLV